MIILSLLLLFFSSCESQNPESFNKISYEINGRDKKPLYRINAPKEWHVQMPEEVQDTTVPLAEFTFEEIKITIHNFPSFKREDRVPPAAQLMRWKKQFETLSASYEQPQNFAGFVGLFIEASGMIKQKEMTLLSWSLQIANTHYGALENEERRADCTIKALGPSHLMKKYKTKIIAFARSFELIDEIPHD